MNDPLPIPELLNARGAPLPSALAWRNDFAMLSPRFYTRLAPTPLPEPYLVAVADATAELIGLDPRAAQTPEFLAAFAGNATVAGSDPIAAVYAGHQFGVYVPQLGDGRAHLLGGVTGPDGRVWELQLKGSGKTPYSRMGDGRAVLRSSIREFLASEAMHALGIPTTRALAVIGSDHPVIREGVETAAVVTRVAPSFVRFGSFEFFYWRQLHEELRQLADYVIETFYPECRAAGSGSRPYLALLEEVTRRTARLIAQWQGVGFCHGVMNTDNMSILGQTIDYGPYGFIDGFDAGHVCNHSDEHGRYAYRMQPQIAHWNLYCLGQALVPLTDDVEATQAALGAFEEEFTRAADEIFHAKLGLTTAQESDRTLIESLFTLLHTNRTDWTLFWRRLSQLRLAATDPSDDAPVRDLFVERAAFDAWARDYRARLAREASDDAARAARMNRVNPKYVLRNYLAETAIRAASGMADDGSSTGARDFSEVTRLARVLERPYDEQPEFESYAALPPDWAAHLHLSCSS